MKSINILLKFLFLLSCIINIITNAIIVGHAYNVLKPENFGAIGDGKANDWHAIQKTLDTCGDANYSTNCTVLFEQSYLTGYIVIKSNFVTLDIQGTITMLPKKEYIKLPNYDQQNFITNNNNKSRKKIKIVGGGTIRSNDGLSWWTRKLTGGFRPHLLTLSNVEDVLIKNIHFEDSPNHNIEVGNCTTVRVDQLYVKAPQTSPNTDGINFYGGRDQSLTNSIISNGDDCVSVVNLGEADVDCQKDPLLLKCRGGNVIVKNVTCLGGHGISIGGMRNGTISNVTFENMTATGGITQGIYSSGGLRVKSYPNGKGYAYDILYKDIILDGVYLPIQLLGRYCPWPSKCPPSKTAVQFENISFVNIRGTSRELETVGVISCAKVAPCKNIFFDNVVLKSKLKDSKNSKMKCDNVENVTFHGGSLPQVCQ